MADFAITVSNSVNVFGPGPPSQWGVMIWGTDSWGYGGSMELAIGKLISETQTLADSYVKAFSLSIANSITPTTDASEMYLQDANAYYYNFTKPTTDGDDQVISDYTEVSASDSTWTAASDASSDWSEA